MSDANAIIAPKEEDLEAFWVHAINVAKLNPAEAVMGQNDFLSLRPAAFAFGATRAEADRECAQLLAGEKTTIVTPAADYEGENSYLPQEGDLAIVCDGAGIPRALIVTKQVEVTPTAVTEHIAVLYQH